MKQIFTVDIIETWVKKVKVIAEGRNEALAQAKADLITDKKDSPTSYLAQDPEAFVRDIDLKLEWPDGNPKSIDEK